MLDQNPSISIIKDIQEVLSIKTGSYFGIFF
jgi:hypothetical protein